MPDHDLIIPALSSPPPHRSDGIMAPQLGSECGSPVSLRWPGVLPPLGSVVTTSGVSSLVSGVTFSCHILHTSFSCHTARCHSPHLCYTQTVRTHDQYVRQRLQYCPESINQSPLRSSACICRQLNIILTSLAELIEGEHIYLSDQIPT